MKLRQNLIDAFAQKGFDCVVALPKTDIALWQERYPRFHFLPLEAFLGTSIGLLDNLKTFFKIKKLIREVDPEVVFLGNVKPNIYGGIAAYRCGVKHIYGLISG